MSTLADILNTGRHALRVQQLAMQIVGQNMANVGTEGYSRRRVDLSVAAPYGMDGRWNVGSGVDIDRLGRVRDRLLDDQIQRAGAGLGYWSQRDDGLARVEEIFGELGENGIGDQLQQFWDGWNDVANSPESLAPRLALMERAETLASGVRRAYAELDTRRQNADAQIVQSVEEVNRLTAQIAQLNIQIEQIEMSGGEASDMRDTRGVALDRLSSLVTVATSELPGGGLNVYLNGQVLVQGNQSVALNVTQVATDNSTRTIVYHGTGVNALQAPGGEIQALMELRDEDISSAMADLDTFATTLASRVNAVHRTGYGLTGTNGVDFFAAGVTGAADLRLDALLIADPARIASAASADAPGDNSVALQLAGIQNEQLLENGRSTLGQFFRDSVLRIGARKAHALSQFEVEQGAMDSLVNRRLQVSAVSLDEEMTRLVQVQQAYDAAARVISTVDEMMQTVLTLGA